MTQILAPGSASGQDRLRYSAASGRVVVRTVAMLATVVGAVAGLALVGWAADLGWAKTVGTGLASMKPNTAFCLLLLASTYLVPARPARVAAAVTAAVAGVSLVEYTAHLGHAFDQVLFRDPSATQGRMALLTAVSLLILGLARLLAVLGRGQRVAEVGSALVLGIGATALLGYLYGVRDLYSFGPLSTMAVHTAAALVLLATAGVLAAPAGFGQWVVLGQDAGAVLLRRVLPVLVLVIPATGFLSLRAEEAGWIQAQVGLAITVASSLASVGIASAITARNLTRSDTQRRDAVASLHLLNEDLERRIAERADQLHTERSARTLLEDRQRIAADMHDNVIQRIFLLGLRLDALSPGAITTEQIDDLSDIADAAIRDLRHSISTLNAGVERVDLAQELNSIVHQAADPVPTLQVDGDLGAVPPQVVQQLLAAAREAVSNATRHANASAITVHVAVTDRDIALRVADDGIGLDPNVVSTSGMRNIARRAEQLGGACAWYANPPHGTAVSWSAPLHAPDAASIDRIGTLAKRKQAASTQLAIALRDQVDDPAVFLAAAAARLVDADAYLIYVPDTDGALQVIRASGLGLETFLGTVIPTETSIAGHVFTTGVTTRIDRVRDTPQAADTLQDQPLGPCLVAPLPGLGHITAVVAVIRQLGRAPFSTADDDALSSFLHHAGLLLETAQHMPQADPARSAR